MFKTTKKDFNLKTWCKAGIYYVNDLVHLEEGRFMTLKELKDMYGLRSNFLEYYRILSTIKNTFRQLFGPNVDIFKINNPFIPFHLSLILKDKRGCKSLCYLLASFKEPKSIIRWESKLNVSFLRSEWKIFCLIPFKCTMDTKLILKLVKPTLTILRNFHFSCSVSFYTRTQILRKEPIPPYPRLQNKEPI